MEGSASLPPRVDVVHAGSVFFRPSPGPADTFVEAGSVLFLPSPVPGIYRDLGDLVKAALVKTENLVRRIEVKTENPVLETEGMTAATV